MTAEERDAEEVNARVRRFRNRIERKREQIRAIEREQRSYLSAVGWADADGMGIVPTPFARCKGGGGCTP